MVEDNSNNTYSPHPVVGRSGQILWIRGLTRLQTQVEITKYFTFSFIKVFLALGGGGGRGVTFSMLYVLLVHKIYGELHKYHMIFN